MWSHKHINGKSHDQITKELDVGFLNSKFSRFLVFLNFVGSQPSQWKASQSVAVRADVLQMDRADSAYFLPLVHRPLKHARCLAVRDVTELVGTGWRPEWLSLDW